MPATARPGAAHAGGVVPVPLTPFVGRQRELAAALQLLRDGARLLTLVGPAGVGKTRLGIALAAASADLFPDGARFVRLAPIVDAELVPGLVAAAVGVIQRRTSSLVAAMAERVGDQRLLLVLDNFEHVLAAAPLIPELLGQCPGLGVVATSRTPLHLSAEYLVPVPTLSLPARVAEYRVDDLQTYEAIQLFIARAAAACGSFNLTADNAPSVVDICCNLDGLPLAIELATARLRVLPAQALVQRLQPGLPLLASAAQDVPARLRSMRDAIAWSYDLLAPAQQILFRRLGVFAGGFSIEAVEAVCMPGIEDIDPLEGVSALLDHSLLRRADQAASEPRLEMLYVVREFALDRLAAAGEDDAVRRAHVQYLRRLAQQAGAARGADQERAHAHVALEMNNIRAALAWALRASAEPRDLEDACELCGALWFFWIHYSTTPDEARLWLRRALERAPEAHSPARARALVGLGAIEWRQGAYALARQHLNESAALFQELGNLQQLGYALHLVGHVLFEGREYDGAQLSYERSHAAHTQVGDVVGGLPLVGDLGMVAYHRGDLATARRQFEACLRGCREHGVRDHAADSLNRLGDLARLEGDLEWAQQLYAESLTLWRSVQGRPGIASNLHKLGQTARRRGQLDDARRLLLESLDIQREIGNRQGVIECLCALAGLALEWGAAERVVELFGAAEAALADLGAPLAPADQVELERDRARALASLSVRVSAAAQTRGQQLELAEAVRLAESLASPAAPEPDVEAPAADLAQEPSRWLSPREVEVARLLARGLSNREIAADLTITEKTAANHLEHIMTKLDLRSRAQVAVWAVRHGLA